MADGNPPRLRVVGGTETEPTEDGQPFDGAVTKPTRAPRKRPAMKDQLTPWHCAACTEETGMYQHQMVQVLRDPHEANGKLVAGSLWWACARCLKTYYRIRTFGQRS